MSTENIAVAMMRPTLDDLPQFELPAPYQLRWYQPGDEAAWVAIHVAADRFHTFTPATFQKEFSDDQTLLPTRQAYLCQADGSPIGTATAWFKADDDGSDWGLIHWVAIHPEMQGRGLAKPLLAVVCHHLQALGYQRAYLSTSTARLPAINLYLAFGFVPILRGDRAETLYAWQQVHKTLDHPALAHFLTAEDAKDEAS